MIRVHRSPCPRILNQHGQGWLNALQQAKTSLENIRNNPNSTKQEKKDAEKSFKAIQSKYTHPTIKKALQTMFNGGVMSKSTKCAYCETPIESPKGQDIEHFYPKAIYPNRTFEWDNLLIACFTCNEEFKRDDFPVNANGNPLLINPTSEDPANHLSFLFDVQTLESHIEGKDDMERETVDFFALNGLRTSDMKQRNLAEVRRVVISGWIAMALLIQNETDLNQKQYLLEKFQKLCLSRSQYAAFARAIYNAM